MVSELEVVRHTGYCLKARDNGTMSPVDMSITWLISQPQIKCYIATCDASFQTPPHAARLSSGKSLPVYFSSYTTHVEQVQGKEHTIPIAGFIHTPQVGVC